jgi:hypothetical protein
MKISVIMIDGGFRENAFGIDFFTKHKVHPDVIKHPKIKVITLGRRGIYHSSYCFNKGIIESKGEVIVIPDADQIVKTDFLSNVWSMHSLYDKLVVYGYRYDQNKKEQLHSFDFEELERKCHLKNPTNYGGCLTVRKKWLLELNGYEQHPIFRTGYHANGLDMYTRFKNLGLSIQWEPTLKLYHPWHSFTLKYTREQIAQKKMIEWRKQNLQWLSFIGIDPVRNVEMPQMVRSIVEIEMDELKAVSFSRFIKNVTKILIRAANECLGEIKDFIRL